MFVSLVNHCLQITTNTFTHPKNDHCFFWGRGGGGGVKFVCKKGSILSHETFIQVENSLRQAGSGARLVDRSHLSDRQCWGIKFNFWQFGAFLVFSCLSLLSNVCCQNNNLEQNLEFYSLKKFF